MNVTGEPIDVVIINFNGRSIIDKTIASLKKQTYPIGTIIVVDDCSTDGTVEFLREQYPDIVLVVQKMNTKMVNALRSEGARRARSSRILFTDNDIVFEPLCLEHLVRELGTVNATALCTPRLMYNDGSGRIYNDWCLIHYAGVSGSYNREKQIRDAQPPAAPQPTAGGGIFLLDRAKGEEIDFFDPDFLFGWGDDGSFYHRLKMQGYGCYCVCDAICYHEAKARTAQRSLGQVHNRWLFILKFYSIKSIILFIPVFILYELSLFVFLMIKKAGMSYFRALKRILCNLGSIVRHRSEIQKKRKVADKYLFSAPDIYVPPALLTHPIISLFCHINNTIYTVYWKFISRVL